MIVGRGLVALRRAPNIFKTVSNRPYLEICRNSHKWYYRTGVGEIPKLNIYLAEGAGAVMWWWILWHVFTEPDHLFGEYPMPDPTKWSDAELGIPPDDA